MLLLINAAQYEKLLNPIINTLEETKLWNVLNTSIFNLKHVSSNPNSLKSSYAPSENTVIV